MATYNLIKNSIFRSVTSSGTGNKSLTQEELAILTDGLTTYSGVSLSTSDVLYLDVDFHQRININGIFIYADDLTKLNNIDFYFKNYAEEDFYGCTKGVSTVYTAAVPSPSSPRYVRCVISGVDITLYEFSIFNDETKVRFGEEGTLQSTWLTDTPIGDLGTPQAIEIYNNSNTTVTAYACVDFVNDDDHFIKLASSVDGQYAGFEDNVVVGYDYKSWDSGAYDNVHINSTGALELIDKGTRLIDRPTYIGNAPVLGCYYRGKPFGICNGWVYDHVNKFVWAAFYVGTDNTGGSIKLYKFESTTNVWTYRCDLYTTDFSATAFAMTCDDTNVYVSMDSSSYLTIFKHDPLGALGNLTQVATYNDSSYAGHARSLAADYSGFIYMVTTDNNYGTRIIEYEVGGTGTGTNLAAVPGNNITEDQELYLVYSPYDGFIYLGISNTDSKYLLQYRRSTNTWITGFFDYGTHINTLNSDLRIVAHDTYIYFYSSHYGSSIYRYDLSTDTTEQKDIDIPLSSEDYPHLIITDPNEPADDFSAFIFGSQGTNFYNMYGYNTGFESGSVSIDITSASGTYTTPIIYLDDPFMSSYFKINATSVVGSTSISKDTTVHDGTIELRSSAKVFTPIDEIYWFMSLADSEQSLFKYTLGTEVWEKFRIVVNYRTYSVYDTAVCRRTGKIACWWRYTYISTNFRLGIFTRENTIVLDDLITSRSDKGACFDGTGALWWCAAGGAQLFRMPVSVITVTYDSPNEIYAIAAELNGTDCWFVERDTFSLNRLSSAGVLETTVSLVNPYGLCSTEDLCVWVSQVNDIVYGDCVQKFNRAGELVTTVQLPEAGYRMAYDHDGGFYILGDSDIGNLYHYNSEGHQTLKITGYTGYEFLKAGRRGFVAFNPVENRATYFSRTTGEVLWTDSAISLGQPVGNQLYCPDIFTWDEESEQNFSPQYNKLLPVSYDPVWFGTDNLPWVEIPKDGYFLPNNIRHQLRITLRNYDGESTPTVYNITMAPAIKIIDIPSKESRPMYVRSDIPADAPSDEFGLRIKVWWSEED